MNTNTLIRKLKQGDRLALKQLYLSCKNDFKSFLFRYCNDADLIEDIYQDAILVFYENCIDGKLDTIKSKPKTYIFSTGKFMLFKYYRDHVNKLESLEDYRLGEEEQKVMLDIMRNEKLTSREKYLVNSFDKLGEKCQEILNLFYKQGYSIAEITEIMQYDNKNVTKSKKSHCLKTLKTLLKQTIGQGNIIK